MDDVLQFLLANPLLLIPLLLAAAMVVFALLKRLLKLAAVVAIAGALYVFLAEYMAGGL